MLVPIVWNEGTSPPSEWALNINLFSLSPYPTNTGLRRIILLSSNIVMGNPRGRLRKRKKPDTPASDGETEEPIKSAQPAPPPQPPPQAKVAPRPKRPKKNAVSTSSAPNDDVEAEAAKVLLGFRQASTSSDRGTRSSVEKNGGGNEVDAEPESEDVALADVVGKGVAINMFAEGSGEDDDEYTSGEEEELPYGCQKMLEPPPHREPEIHEWLNTPGNVYIPKPKPEKSKCTSPSLNSS